MDQGSVTHRAEELLGPLNEFERKYAPEQLYAQGRVELLRLMPRVAVVGSRRASPDGLKRAARVSKELAAENVLVVSGLAEGIDTAAHRAAIAAGGRTLAVVGTPLDQSYPKSNAELQGELAREHLLLSQFAPGQPVQRANFPLRNRLMALVADATVIVEARDGSGTIHQAWEAIRLGRPLFLMRSILDDRSIQWPQLILDHGAELLADTRQIFDILPARRPHTLEDAPF